MDHEIMTRHFLSLFDFNTSEIETLLQRAITLKTECKSGIFHKPLANKTLGLLFEKTSTRTYVSFDIAMFQLGGHTVSLTQGHSQLSRGETVEDTARVLSRYVQGIVMRTYEHKRLQSFAECSRIPVINGLTDLLHPCQVLADLVTLVENKKTLQDLKVSWFGDGNNMANTWIEAAMILGFSLTLACPKGYDPDGFLMEKATSGQYKNIRLTRDPFEAAFEADAINTDTWISMGQEGKQEIQKKQKMKPYQVNENLLKTAKEDCVVLHCLPAHRGEEITDDVMDGPKSKVWDEAENRLHVQKALLEKLLS